MFGKQSREYMEGVLGNDWRDPALNLSPLALTLFGQLGLLRGE